ncbi:MAG: lamin tail domain-containing protein [Candidatus Zixiibacteriota bacterium]
MVKYFKHSLVIIIALLMLIVNVQAKLLINEIMANEPGSNTSLEWIEVYNDSTTIRNLQFATLIIDGVNYPLGIHPVGSVEPHEYAVICKNKILYDSAWGDNSGVWGDDVVNEYYPVYQVTGFNLINISGEVGIQYFSENSTLNWSRSGLDGYSWERIHRDSIAARQSIDPSGSTPGRINSTRLLNNNLKLLTVSAQPYVGGFSHFDIYIANVGTDTVFSGSLNVYHNDDLDSTYDPLDLIAEITYNTILPGDTITIEYIDIFFGVYPHLLFILPDDEDNADNLQLVAAFGVDYPPIIINEFLANPQYDSKIEWIELKNYLDVDINLNGWSIGDSLLYKPISFEDYILSANSYLVLCKDSAGLAAEYGLSDIPILEISSWPTLNDGFDIVRLKDNHDITSDSVSYSHTFAENITWGRSESEEDLYVWGRSVVEGGSPGRQNAVYTEASASKLNVDVDHNPLSLSSGEEMTITFDSPPGENLIMRIYDLEGRVVKTIFNSNSGSFDGTIGWNGTSDDGRNLKIGIYILYVEVSDADSYKQTVVIAP